MHRIQSQSIILHAALRGVAQGSERAIRRIYPWMIAAGIFGRKSKSAMVVELQKFRIKDNMSTAD